MLDTYSAGIIIWPSVMVWGAIRRHGLSLVLSLQVITNLVDLYPMSLSSPVGGVSSTMPMLLF